jgi:2-ketocyclohexanecarboxyl-CoA hydrolase
LYKVFNGVATITINRPEEMNLFRGQSCDELTWALNQASLFY